MSGHSKWSSIKRQKGVTDAKRGTLFTKLANAITLAAREGGSDPNANFKLRLTIEKAKQANMPKDNIERAAKRGTGEGSEKRIEEVIYEGFGPDGVAILIESLTDNKNRTTPVIRGILGKKNGRLGENGSVSWMFERKGVILVLPPEGSNKEEIELELIDLGAEDIKKEPEGFTIYTTPEKLEEIKEALDGKNYSVEYASIDLVAKTILGESDISDPEKISDLLEELENNEEVTNVYSNYES
ncbi:YebC/PmpR family DNA-binding transcriptional regulator [Patescibacteria group bacterium]|nr:YebC/PmpR family DNA-binding transcriptional regulator [Patescibacteria group bacterium]MBU1074941.1 YebC/PmpR family DNA-binding transcriptional regulator [Patescibacteria group bacterium]MBU1951674.1 YebC/PmpR family DNA-binding transcriptional regulator [Patescibacteria group bacterium]MBU2228801.1 YebC/PmpR family DNA-binding transcriptional regulator [Patescibacteria group bacterium]MBU2236297.1 YebC/PmpR family DNA-binding transcriptional regulator [Patescibacteria group bacterium]